VTDAERQAIAQLLLRQAMTEQLGQPKSAEEGLYQQRVMSQPFFSEFAAEHGEAPDLNDPEYDYRAALNQQSISGDVFGRDPYDPQMTDMNFQRETMGAPMQGRIHGDSRFKAQQHPSMWKEQFMQLSGQNPDAMGIQDGTEADRMLLSRRLRQ